MLPATIWRTWAYTMVTVVRKYKQANVRRSSLVLVFYMNDTNKIMRLLDL